MKPGILRSSRVLVVGEVLVVCLAALLLVQELVFSARFDQFGVGDVAPAALGSPDESFPIGSVGIGAQAMLWRGLVLPIRWWVEVDGQRRVLRKGSSCWLTGQAALSEDPPEPVGVTLLRVVFVLAAFDLVLRRLRIWRSRGASPAA